MSPSSPNPVYNARHQTVTFFKTNDPKDGKSASLYDQAAGLVSSLRKGTYQEVYAGRADYYTASYDIGDDITNSVLGINIEAWARVGTDAPIYLESARSSNALSLMTSKEILANREKLAQANVLRQP